MNYRSVRSLSAQERWDIMERRNKGEDWWDIAIDYQLNATAIQDAYRHLAEAGAFTDEKHQHIGVTDALHEKSTSSAGLP